MNALARQPNFIQRIKLAVAFVLNRYEAGQRGTDGRRRYLDGWVRDARFDADSSTRLEMVRKSRYFERNSAILNRLADLFEQYTVGPNGLRFIPRSSDEKWNASASEFWDEWCQFCDLTTLQDFGTIQSLAARSWFIDGEVFIYKTNGRLRANERSFPRIQMIETHRISTPSDQYGSDRVIDGIETDDRGRPIAYHFNEGFSAYDEQYKRVPWENMIHVFEPSRPNMMRGLPFTYPVINDLHDLDDLQMLTMDKAKDAAATTTVIKTKTGEIDDDDLRRARFNIGGTQGTSGGSDQERSTYYDDMIVGRSKARVLRHGDDIAQLRSEHPSIADERFWDHLTSKACAGTGISKLLVFPYSMQGTVVRADLDVSAGFFRSRSHVLASKFTDIYEYVLGWGVINDRRLQDKPGDWKKVAIRPPRSVTVDIGRNSNAVIEEYKAGFRTLEQICAEMGEDWREIMRQRALEMSVAMELEIEFKLKPGTLIQSTLEAIKQAEPKQPQMQEAA